MPISLGLYVQPAPCGFAFLLSNPVRDANCWGFSPLCVQKTLFSLRFGRQKIDFIVRDTQAGQLTSLLLSLPIYIFPHMPPLFIICGTQEPTPTVRRGPHFNENICERETPLPQSNMGLILSKTYVNARSLSHSPLLASLHRKTRKT